MLSRGYGQGDALVFARLAAVNLAGAGWIRTRPAWVEQGAGRCGFSAVNP